MRKSMNEKSYLWTKGNMTLSASKVENSTHSMTKGRDEYIIL